MRLVCRIPAPLSSISFRGGAGCGNCEPSELRGEKSNGREPNSRTGDAVELFSLPRTISLTGMEVFELTSWHTSPCTLPPALESCLSARPLRGRRMCHRCPQRKSFRQA